MASLHEELEYLESLEKTPIDQEVIDSFEEYLTLLEKQGSYEGLKKTLKYFLAYSVVMILIFNQMNAGPAFKFNVSNLFSMLPLFLQNFLQGLLFACGGWALVQKFMSPLEKKMFSILWIRHVSIITFFTGLTFWVFGDASFFGLICWITGAFLGAHLVTKQ